MTTKLTFVCALLMTISLQAQPDSWAHLFQTGSPSFDFQSQPYGGILEKNNSVLFLTGYHVKEISHYGRVIHDFVIPPQTGFSGKTYFYFLDQKEDNGNDYIIAAHRGGEDGGTFIHTAFMDGTLALEGFHLEDEVLVDVVAGHAAIKADDGDYLFFGQTQIYKLNIPDPYTINIVWNKQKSDRPVSRVKKDVDGYITCSEEGWLEKYDLEGNLVWSKDLEYPMYEAVSLDDGYITCGNIDNVAGLKKADENGTVLWEQSYGGKEAYSVLPCPDGGFILTGRQDNLGYFITKTDTEGNEIWTKIESGGRHGFNIRRGRYGGYSIQATTLFGQGAVY